MRQILGDLLPVCRLLCCLSIPVGLPSSELGADKLLFEDLTLTISLGRRMNAGGGGVIDVPVTAVPLMIIAGFRASDLSRDSLVPWLYSELVRLTLRRLGEFNRETTAFRGVGGRCSAIE